MNPTITSTLRERTREGEQLVRSTGPEARVGFSAVPASLHELCTLDASLWHWDAGEGDASQRRYRIPASSRSLADLALDPTSVDLSWSAALANIGAALRRLHALPLPENLTVPAALVRLDDFLHGHNLHQRAVFLRGRFLQSASESLCNTLVFDTALAQSPRQPVLSHGWAGLGRWYPTSASTAIGLIGEDLGAADAEHDLAAPLAQLIELRFFRGFDALTANAAERALLQGYGIAVERERLQREVRLAVMRHFADVCVHAACPDEEPARWAALLEQLPPSAQE